MTMALMIPTLIAYLLVIKEVFSHDLPKVVSTPRRIVLPDVDSSNSEESLGSDSGHMKGRRELLAPLILSETNCPYTDGSCESAPTFLPPSGGSFNHAGAVQVMIDRAGAEVRYTLDGTEPNKHSTGVIHAGSAGGLVELRIDPPCPLNRFSNRSNPTYCTFNPRNRDIVLKARTMSRWNNTKEDSYVTTATYTIWTGRHGRAMLVPYYHGQANELYSSMERYESGLGYSGKLVEVQLNTLPFKSVHMHDIITDFAEYIQFVDGVTKTGSRVDSDTVGLDTQDSADSDNKFMDASFSTPKTQHEFFVTAHGVDPLPVTSHWSKALGNVPYTDQVKVLDLANQLAFAGANQLRGFWSGFSAISTAGVEYGFLVPYFDGQQYSGLAVRVDMDAFHNATDSTRGDSVTVLNLTATDERARGFGGGFSADGYAYFVPLFDGVRAGSLVVRASVDDFSSSSVQVLDLSDPYPSATPDEADDDPNLASEVPRKSLSGFQGGRAYTSSDGEKFGLLIPYRNSISPIHGVNSKLTADGYNGLDVMREMEAVGGGHQESHYSSIVVRFSLSHFAASNVTTLDLATIDPDLRGFSDGVVVGKYLYLVPYKNHDSSSASDSYGYFGKVVRIDLETFDGYKSVTVMDLTMLDSSLVGFSAGFFWGKTLLLVPNRNAQGSVKGTFTTRKSKKGSYLRRSQHGKLVGIDLTKDFADLSSVSVLDLSTVTRQQIPKMPDPELRGFVGGFASGDYAYLVPHSNGVFFGKLVRIDMRDFEALATKQRKQALLEAEHVRKQEAMGVRFVKPLSKHDGTDDGSRTGTNLLGHDGVQILDLQWQDKQLCGFSGGFASATSDY